MTGNGRLWSHYPHCLGNRCCLRPSLIEINHRRQPSRFGQIGECARVAGQNPCERKRHGRLRARVTARAPASAVGRPAPRHTAPPHSYAPPLLDQRHFGFVEKNCFADKGFATGQFESALRGVGAVLWIEKQIELCRNERRAASANR